MRVPRFCLARLTVQPALPLWFCGFVHCDNHNIVNDVTWSRRICVVLAYEEFVPKLDLASCSEVDVCFNLIQIFLEKLVES